MRCGARTGRLIVERTCNLPSAPGLKPSRRQPREPKRSLATACNRARANARPRRIRSLAGPSGRRSPESLKPEARNRANANRSSPVSFSTRRRSFRISCRSCGSGRSATSRLTTTIGAARSHPRAVERRDSQIGGEGQVPGALDEIPEPMVVALLRAGCGRHPDNHRPFADAAQLLRGRCGSVRWRDDNSRSQVHNVRGDGLPARSQASASCAGVAFFLPANRFSTLTNGVFAARFSGEKRSNPDLRSVFGSNVA